MTVTSERVTARRELQASVPSDGLRYLPLVALGLDAFIMGLAVMAAALIRRAWDVFPQPDRETTVSAIGPLLILGWLLLNAVFGTYRRDEFGEGTDEFKRVFHASMYAAGFLGMSCYLAHHQLSRGFFVMTFVLGVPLLLIGRLMLRRTIRSMRTRGHLRQRVVIAGGPSHVDEIAAVLARESWLGYQVVGALTPANHHAAVTASGIPVIGNADDPAPAVGEADILFLTGGTPRSADDLRQIVWDLEQHHLQLVVAPSVTDLAGDRVKIRPMAGLPLVHLAAPRWSRASGWAKRSFDLVGSSLLILLFSPLLLLAALRIRMYDGGPMLYRQIRIGRDGEAFRCLKFRSMIVDADSRISELQAGLGADALLFKMKDDPRITPPGRWLRRYSIDELPQLFNVFRGDMSLVGPRPQVAAEVAMYDDAMRRRLHVRPGMTGLWQVSGRNDLTVEEAMRLDLYYVDNWSIAQDLSILVRTFGAVVSAKGAY
jgi:exopolysaccharide biosynthesis polyprenyl glycosylphosphotransferase